MTFWETFAAILSLVGAMAFSASALFTVYILVECWSLDWYETIGLAAAAFIFTIVACALWAGYFTIT